MRGTSTYNDRFFRMAAAAVGAYFVTEFGGEGGYFSSRRVLTLEFYIEYGSSLVIAAVLVELIAWVTRVLDRYYDWQEKAVLRIGLQVLLGIALPGLIDFLLASLYFRLFGVDILDTTYLLYAMPYIILMITLFNLCYVTYYFYLRLDGAGSISREPTGSSGKEKYLRNAFMVSKGAGSLSIPVEDIAYFYRYGRQTFLYTFGEKEYVLHLSLDNVEQELPDDQYFRVNRRMIIHYKTFSFLESAGSGRLKLGLKSPPPREDAVLVSQDKASSFKNWLDR